MGPRQPRAAYASFEAIPDGFKRRGVAADFRYSTRGEFHQATAGMADARDRERNFLSAARRDRVAVPAEGLFAMADGLPLVCPVARRGGV